MDYGTLADTLYDQLDRGQIRDFLAELTGKRPAMKLPEAVEVLTDEIKKMSLHARHEFWPGLLEEFGDWQAVCDDLDLPRSRNKLRDFLLGAKSNSKEKKSNSKDKSTSKYAKSKVELEDGVVAKITPVMSEDHVRTLVDLIDTAEREVVLVAYVLGRSWRTVNEALHNAAERNVMVRLVLDGREKNSGCGKKNKNRAKTFHEDFQVMYGKVHAKFTVIDKRYALLGSSNLDDTNSDIYQANVLLDSQILAVSLLDSLDNIQSVID